MSAELKPCPFCGGDDISVDKAGNASHYFCTCNDCDVFQDFDHNYTPADAIAAWNRRSHDARLIEALEPFADVSGEGDEDFPDDTPVTITFGRSTHYAIKLGDFRRAVAVLSQARDGTP